MRLCWPSVLSFGLGLGLGLGFGLGVGLPGLWLRLWPGLSALSTTRGLVSSSYDGARGVVRVKMKSP